MNGEAGRRTMATPASFTTKAEEYALQGSQEGLENAIRFVEWIMRSAMKGRPSILLNAERDDQPRTTRLEFRNGTVIEHDVSSPSSGTWAVNARMHDADGDGVCVRFVVESSTRPTAIMPDHATQAAALKAVLRTIRSSMIHLKACRSARQMEDAAGLAQERRESQIAVAHAETPPGAAMVGVRHATPWEPMRVLDLGEDSDLLTDDARSRMPKFPTRLHVEVDDDGDAVTIEGAHDFVTVPDPIERLRTLAATTRHAA